MKRREHYEQKSKKKMSIKNENILYENRDSLPTSFNANVHTEKVEKNLFLHEKNNFTFFFIQSYTFKSIKISSHKSK